VFQKLQEKDAELNQDIGELQVYRPFHKYRLPDQTFRQQAFCKISRTKKVRQETGYLQLF